MVLVAAAGQTEVKDLSGLMQDIAPKKGWKLHKLSYQLATSDLAFADGSHVYLNALKNISEAAHHQTPSSAGDISDTRVAGVIFSDFLLCGASHWANGRVSDLMEKDFGDRPVEFDGDDRFNMEYTFKNADAAQQDCHLRMFLDVEVL